MTELSRGVRCSRIAFCLINILFFIFGIAVMSTGIFVQTNRNFNAIKDIHTISESFGHNTMQSIAISMIIVGVLTACLSAVGCIGAIHEKRGFLYMHSIVLILILICECIGMIVLIAYRNSIYKTYDSGFMEVFHHAYRNNNTKTIRIIENIERDFLCCGVDGPSDYTKADSIPLSCRPSQSIVYKPFDQGCAQAVIEWTWNCLPIIASLLGSVFLLELFGLICSLIVGVGLSRSEKVGTYKEI